MLRGSDLCKPKIRKDLNDFENTGASHYYKFDFFVRERNSNGKIIKK